MISVNAQTPNVAAETALKALLDEDLDATLRRNPIQATVRGIPGYGHLLPDVSPAELEREHARERRALERLRALDAKAFHGQDRISYELLRDKMELAVEAQQFTAAEALVLSTLGGLQTFMPRAAQVTPFRKADDYRDYIRRLRAMPKLVDDTIERLKPGLASGWALAFINSFDEVTMTVFIAAPGTETLPVRMFLYIQDNIDPLVT